MNATATNTTATSTTAPLRAQLVKFLEGKEAHVGLDVAVAGVPPELRGRRPDGAPHSLWELLEHVRITQHDILSFCVDREYEEPAWPDDYWPKSPAPPTAEAWDASVDALKRDLAAMQQLAANENVDLFAKVPHGTGQTYLREVLLVGDHNAYHVGAFVLTRRLLGIWPAS